MKHLSQIARDILMHMLENPGARDTLEGIAQWWLLQRAIHRYLPGVREAVKNLISLELIIEANRAGAAPTYMINPSRREEIRELVRFDSCSEG